ncbi:MAG: phosphatidylserine decarboxylase family protein [Bacteroidales bacterium]|nr:phosphatidylserine decarboxylase family protein [Bacteroidales bacterium]
MIHKEGRISVLLTFVMFAAIILAIMLAFGVNWITIAFSVAFLALFCFVAYFFRDPHRQVKSSANNEILSSADGKVVIVKEVEENEFLHSKCIQVSVFMSIWSVHVNYYPCKGTVVYRNYHPGNYLVAWHPKSSEKNERTSIGIKTEGGKEILVRQIAGYVARRVVCYAKEGDKVFAGEQMGFIKFGSRVDFFLPFGSEVLVKEGDKVRACQTVIANLGVS